MALTATMRRFTIALADSDRGVYDELDLRVAQHPSESDRYLVARVIARALEHAEGVDFTRGLAADDEPALWQRDLRNDLQAWIEVGTPATDRLHRAAKASPRVAVYGWKGVEALAEAIIEARVHRGDQIALHAIDPAFLDAVAATLDRNNRWDLSVAGGQLYLATAAGQLETAIARVAG